MVNATAFMPNVSLANVVNLEPIQSTISLILKIAGGVIALYVIYLIIRFIHDRIQSRRIKKTYRNSEEILNRLDDIETKLDKAIGKKKPEKEKEEKVEKKKK